MHRLRAETPTSSHIVQFYEGDASFAERALAFIEAGRRAGEACIVVATQAHRELIEARLPEAPEGAAPVVTLDARETLSKFLVKGWPDEKRFAATVGAVVARASEGGRRKVRVIGEMVAVLLAEGQAEATLRLEQLWNQLMAERPLSLMCSYPLFALRTEEHHKALRLICAEHSGVCLP